MTNPTFFELLQPGMKLELGSHTFTANKIIEFAEKFDPQRFHLSEAAAKNSHFGALCASGWHTGSIWMRQNVKNSLPEMLRLTEYKGPEPVFGPSPGFENLKWHRPVFVGDKITFCSTLTGKSRHPKRPVWGRVMSLSEGFNQDGKLVFSKDGTVTLRVD